MAMSKKDFIALADVMRGQKPAASNGTERAEALHYQWRKTVDGLACFCARQSGPAGFKRQRWLDYINGECGSNGGSRG
jgi:hypothetical protein